MSVIQVTNVDYLNLIEDIRSEADRLIAQSVSTLLMRYFVSNEYVMLSVLPDSKPFFRELVKMFLSHLHEVLYITILRTEASDAFRYRPPQPRPLCQGSKPTTHP